MRHTRVPALLALLASEHPVSKLGGEVSADGTAPKNLMIRYVEDAVAADATYAANCMANGISRSGAMQSIASPVANFAPKGSTLPVSLAAVIEFLLLRYHAFCT